MSKKTLIALIIMLIILGGLATKVTKTPKTATESGNAKAVLPGIDLRMVEHIEISKNDASTHLARVNDNWCVTEQNNYPADFNRLRGMIQAIDNARISETIPDGLRHLQEFGLGEEDTPETITIKDTDSSAVLYLGKTRTSKTAAQQWSPPQGQYVRVNDGPIILLKNALNIPAATPAQWLDHELLNVNPDTIQKISLTQNDETYTIERGTNNTFTLQNDATGAALKTSEAQRLFGALRNLRFDQLVDTSISTTNQFIPTAIYTASTEDTDYTIELGKNVTDPSQNCIRIILSEVSPPAAKEQTQNAKLAKKFHNRIYVIPSYITDLFTMPMKQVIATPAPPSPQPSTAPPAEE